ncbi:MAG: hypothetical protein ABW157_00145 [Candidatus Thiodiazotropha sp. LLP2]
MGVSGTLLDTTHLYESHQVVDQLDSTCDSLARRRDSTSVQWRRFRNRQPLTEQHGLQGEILSSWERSRSEGIAETFQLHAPGGDKGDAERYWQESIIGRAAEPSLSDIMKMADEGNLVASIADMNGRLIWVYANEQIRQRADRVNFTVGSHWHEQAMGTNAIGLSIALSRPATVFSTEHFQPFAHDWVSYAAPIFYPKGGECAGILSISALWQQHTPLGQAAVAELARSIAKELPDKQPRAELEIYVLGQPKVIYRGRQLRLPLRQIEILCLLALNARGLSLEAFHAALYGDTPVSLSTLKAELSHLRRLLNGKIGSRPYRLQISVWGDFIEIWKALRRKNSGEAFSLYRGTLLPDSASPELEEWRHCIDAVMSQALGNCQDPAMLLDKLCRSTSGSELVRERLNEIILNQQIEDNVSGSGFRV